MKNWRLYCAEAIGLAIFMLSACFFTAMLEGNTAWHHTIRDPFSRLVLTGVLMGATALLIFYLPFTAKSGSHINPAVTLTFFRLGRLPLKDTAAYIAAQISGGTIAVYIAAYAMKDTLTMPPVNYAATVPYQGELKAFIIELIIGFVMMSMVLFTSGNPILKKYTRLFAGLLVCAYVIIAGPISGFGMNPARSLASAIPSNTWTHFWIYLLAPVLSMLLAAEVYVYVQRKRTGTNCLNLIQSKKEKAA